LNSLSAFLFSDYKHSIQHNADYVVLKIKKGEKKMSNAIILGEEAKEPSLIIFSGKNIEKVRLKKFMIVGRSTEDFRADINLREDFVSRKHGVIEFDNGDFCYTDFKSSNVTYLNGIKLKDEKKTYLKDGDVLQIFNWQDGKAVGAVTAVFTTDYPESFKTERFALGDDFSEVFIGNNHESKEARFFMAKNGPAVACAEGFGDIFLNGAKIEKPKYLKLGDCVKIKSLCFFYYEKYIAFQKPVKETKKEKSELSSLKIDIKERSVMQHSKKLVLLKNIRLDIDSGDMVLILGGSGAGKTTFMNAVMGYEKANGKIMLGNTDLYADYEAVKEKIGYVPQQDLVRGSDTVFNTLESAAEMKLPVSMKKSDKKKRVEEVLKVFSLWEVKDHLVSKLAGGQKKRISVAVEYIANPSLFFLDEPDSGLDGPEAGKLMQNLRRIADEGKIVMVISHIPDRASNLFDKVIVLAKSKKTNCGHLAFYGSVSEALDYFDTESLEGVVKRINTDSMSDYYIEKYKEENNYANEI